jgi:hypothetical protein
VKQNCHFGDYMEYTGILFYKEFMQKYFPNKNIQEYSFGYEKIFFHKKSIEVYCSLAETYMNNLPECNNIYSMERRSKFQQNLSSLSSGLKSKAA